jgi:hypothetical protein
MLPNFLIIGAPRSGTTWMAKNLRDHPEVFLPKAKELHFFDRDYDKGIEFYESSFTEAYGKKAVGEATPDYLHGAYSKNDIPTLIRKHIPDAKLIVSLRNPIERAYSRFWNAKARYDRNVRMTFEQKLMDRPEFIAEGMYFDQLNRYYALFPKDKILVLLYDELVRDPEAFIRRVYEFLGVREGVRSGWEFVKINQATGKGYLAKSGAFSALSSATSRLKLHRVAAYLNARNSVELPPMNSETRRFLRDVYYEQNCKLQQLTGLDLSAWNAPD